MALPRPPYDPELIPTLANLPLPALLTREMIPSIRSTLSIADTSALPTLLETFKITHTEHIIPTPAGPITLSVFTPSNPSQGPRAAIYNIHGGGMIVGTRFMGCERLLTWVSEFNAVGISVEYRLAPEFPYPVPVNDCYAGWKWVGENSKVLGIDLGRLLVLGTSAGGGLAAGVALMVRDLGGPKICGLVLRCPMLDDRDASISSQQYSKEGLWSRETNVMAWSCYLGPGHREKESDIYAAPARATDLSGLPPTYIDVGSAELFRDEDVAFANRLWEAGIDAELHVWAGGYHTFDSFSPGAQVSIKAKQMRDAWVKRKLEKVQ